MDTKRERPARARITEVARIAGVSVGTVSHVFNQSRPVSVKLTNKVMRAAKRLNYTPNLVARSLRVHNTRTLGVIVSNLENPFFTEIVRAIQDAVHDHGYNVIICSSYEDTAVEEDHILTLRSKQVDGLIIAPTVGDHALLQSLHKDGFPIVIVSRRVARLEVPTIISDNRLASEHATGHFIELGHRHIGLLVHSRNASVAGDQIEGYQMALANAGVAFDAGLVHDGINSSVGGLEAATRMMESGCAPTAVICGTAMMALGSLSYLSQHGLKCPGDLAVIAFGNIPWREVMTPRLTCVTQPTYQIGQRAVSCLLGPEAPSCAERAPVVVLPCGFDHQMSCGCPGSEA